MDAAIDMNGNLNTTLASRIYLHRLILGSTLSEVASTLKVQSSTYSSWERGQHIRCNIFNREKLNLFLDGKYDRELIIKRLRRLGISNEELPRHLLQDYIAAQLKQLRIHEIIEKIGFPGRAFPISEKLSTLIHQKRLARGLSLDSLGKELGISRTMLLKWEHGYTQNHAWSQSFKCLYIPFRLAG